MKAMFCVRKNLLKKPDPGLPGAMFGLILFNCMFIFLQENTKFKLDKK
jgi:hypothetical protein